MNTPAALFILGDFGNSDVDWTKETILRTFRSGETNLGIPEDEAVQDLGVPIRVFDVRADARNGGDSERPSFDPQTITGLLETCEIPFVILILSQVPAGSDENTPERVSNRHLAETLGQIRNACQHAKADEPRVLVLNPNWDKSFWEKVQGSAYPAGTGEFFTLYTAERSTEAALRRQYFALRAIFELHRTLIRVNRGISPAEDVSVKVFISHAKRDGVPLSWALRAQFREMKWMKRFYDFDVLKPGQKNWREVLESGVEESLVLVLRTNAFDQRPWCRQEVMWAEEYARPIVIIDARTHLTQLPSSLPYSACHAVTVPDGDTLRVLTICMRELLRGSLALHKAPHESDATVFLPRPPSLTSLFTALKRIREMQGSDPPNIVYAGPPLENGFRRAAHELIRSIEPRASLHTMTEHRANVTIHPDSPHPAPRSLENHVVGVSASLSENPAEFGMNADELNRVLSRLCEALLGHGARLAFGHDWRPGGVMDAIVSMALQYKVQVAAGSDLRDEDKPRITNFVHAAAEPAMPPEVRDELKGVVDVRQCAELENPPVSDRGVRTKLALLAMRADLVETTDSLIALGGPESSAMGWLPGILEEVLRNLHAGHGVFLCRSFGGVTATLYDAFLGDGSNLAREKLATLLNAGLTEMASAIGPDSPHYAGVYQWVELLDNPDAAQLGGTTAFDAETIATEFLSWKMGLTDADRN